MLYEFQYGFREKHNVIHALLDVNVFALDAFQSKQQTALLIMDVRKAFDTVSHDILLQTLYHYGIRGTAYKLLESYLSFRNQFVSVQNHHSSLKAINIGVPQGSLLGRLLFLVHVNDIPNSVSCNPRLFADDTCLLANSPSLTVLENECNKEMNKLQTWISANELQINLEKSAIIVIPSKLTAQTTNLSNFYNELPINCFESSKYLGVNLDNKLNFRSHICIIENKVASSVGILSKLRCLFPSSSLLLLYYSLIDNKL